MFTQARVQAAREDERVGLANDVWGHIFSMIAPGACGATRVKLLFTIAHINRGTRDAMSQVRAGLLRVRIPPLPLPAGRTLGARIACASA